MPELEPGRLVVCTDIDGNQHGVPVEQLQWRPSVYGVVVKAGALLVAPQFHGYDLPGGAID